MARRSSRCRSGRVTLLLAWPRHRAVDGESTTRTELLSSTHSSRHSGNSVDCTRSAPSTKRFMNCPPANRQANHSTQLVFTQPRSKAEKLKASKCFLLSLQQRTSRHGYVSFVPIDRLMLSIPEV